MPRFGAQREALRKRTFRSIAENADFQVIFWNLLPWVEIPPAPLTLLLGVSRKSPNLHRSKGILLIVIKCGNQEVARSPRTNWHELVKCVLPLQIERPAP